MHGQSEVSRGTKGLCMTWAHDDLRTAVNIKALGSFAPLYCTKQSVARTKSMLRVRLNSLEYYDKGK